MSGKNGGNGGAGNGNAEHVLIADQEIGDSFAGVYFVEQASIKLTVHGKEYTDMLLRDKSGSRPVKFWGKVKGVEKGMWVFVSAMVEEYMGAPSIIARNLDLEDNPPEDMSDYMPVYDHAGAGDFADQMDRLIALVSECEEGSGDETCSRVIEAVFNGSFFARFVEVPGSDKPYYGCVGGLMAATVRVALTAERFSELYDLSDRERAVLYTAALLHRVGAVDTFSFEGCMPVTTAKGVLVGMKNLTMARLTMAVRKAFASPNGEAVPVSQVTAMRLLHAVMSFDGVGLLPSTKEALVLHGAWGADAECVEAVEFIEDDLNEDDEFTAWDPNLRRRYFKG